MYCYCLDLCTPRRTTRGDTFSWLSDDLLVVGLVGVLAQDVLVVVDGVVDVVVDVLQSRVLKVSHIPDVGPRAPAYKSALCDRQSAIAFKSPQPNYSSLH